MHQNFTVEPLSVPYFHVRVSMRTTSAGNVKEMLLQNCEFATWDMS